MGPKKNYKSNETAGWKSNVPCDFHFFSAISLYIVCDQILTQDGSMAYIFVAIYDKAARVC